MDFAVSVEKKIHHFLGFRALNFSNILFRYVFIIYFVIIFMMMMVMMMMMMNMTESSEGESSTHSLGLLLLLEHLSLSKSFSQFFIIILIYKTYIINICLSL